MVDIENELRYYREFFKGKIVLCNCDDPFESNFFKYFAINFNYLGLKKLICTCYAGSPVSYTELNDLPLFHKDERLPYKIEITEVPDMNDDGATDLSDIELLLRSDNNNLTILDGDGDFRSEECIEFLKEADVVVTNPPFSLFREYVAQLIKYKKQFLIIGNKNAITYKEIFPLIKNNELWLGVTMSAGGRFLLPTSTTSTTSSAAKINDDGRHTVVICGAHWFTNIDHKQRHEELILYKHYTPEEYPKYDNYDAINVNRTSDIPCDYYEGVEEVATESVKKKTKMDHANVTASWESRLPSSTSTTRSNSLLSSQMIIDSEDRGEKHLRPERTDGTSVESKNMQESSSKERCSGVMGVPITFLDKYNPEQFELVGEANHGIDSEYDLFAPIVNGKHIFKRILIKRRKHEN